MTLLAVGLILFIGVHLVRVVAPKFRLAMIDRLGDGPWKGIYSLVSIIGLVLLVYGFGLAREVSEQVYETPSWSRGFSLLIVPLALILLFAGNFPAGYIKRALRHPMLMGIALWSLSHLLSNGDTASVLLFGGFFVWSLVTTISAWKRPTNAQSGATKVWPDIASVILALIATWILLRFLHVWMTGVPIV